METIFHLCVIAAVGSGLIAMSHHDNVKYQAAEEQRQIEQVEVQRKKAEKDEQIREQSRKMAHWQMCRQAGSTYASAIETTVKLHDVSPEKAIQILMDRSVIDPTCEIPVVLKKALIHRPWLDCARPSNLSSCAGGGTKAVFVEGHNRNGTWVGPHVRTWPDGNPNNNLSQ